MLLHDIGVEHAVLLEIMRNRVLRQQRRLNPDFGSDPFALRVRSDRSVVTAAATAELGTEVSALDLIELLNLSPGFVAYRARDINF